MTRNPDKPGNKRMGICTYTLADRNGYIVCSQPHSSKRFKYHEKGATLSLMFALLTSEELQGDESDEIKGVNYLEKGHKVSINKY